MEYVGFYFRIVMCIMCGEDFSVDIFMGFILNSNVIYVDVEIDFFVFLELELESIFDGSKQKVEVCVGFYYNFIIRVFRDEEEF